MNNGNHTDKGEALMTVEEVCLVLKIKLDEFNQIIHSDDGFPFVVINNRVMIPEDGLFEWIEEHSSGNNRGRGLRDPKSICDRYHYHYYYIADALVCKSEDNYLC